MPTLLGAEFIGDALTCLTEWQGDARGISRTLWMTDSQYGDFIERVKVTSDAMDHRADITRVGDQIAISLVTHSAGGVTEYDIALASRIDDLARIATRRRDTP
ncbi:MAG TPA: 4a-hydroxytetrahydrobiopterin dehydratase [Mycobacteriales bacterium]|jgi:4a-hydroxytetrahydrobiopterin dehydratase|nr:4a-hydroxytetrahydrobiopterin dehydratase [Mycobacteriales bacterium]